jgi:hypothetical protein
LNTDEYRQCGEFAREDTVYDSVLIQHDDDVPIGVFEFSV